jgi:cysteine desulfurase
MNTNSQSIHPTIYLDNNASTKVAPEVMEVILPYFSTYYANPSSMHSFSGQVARQIMQARQNVAALLGAARPDEIIFTSGGTEGDNTAIRAAVAALPERRHIITTQVEHPAVLNLFQRLEREGYRATYLSVNHQGMPNLNELQDVIDDDTALVSIMCANNETGNVFPIDRMGAIAKAHGALFHVDGVQAVGKLPLDVQNSPIDFLALSGHKLHAPKGIGALYVRRGVHFRPLMVGGHQERSRRGGTENAPGIIGLGKAAELALETLDEERTTVRELRDRLEQGILSMIPDSQINGHPSFRLPNTSNIGFKYVEGEAILLSLDRYGICASSGSACTSGSLEPSHVLRAMGLPYTLLHGSIRFSLSRYTTAEEIEKVLTILPSVIEKLRSISPFTSDNAAWLQNQQKTVVGANS